MSFCAAPPADHDLPPLIPTPPGLYRHHKGGWYEVLDTVRCSETTQALVLYRALYGRMESWVRPQAMFNETARFAPVALATQPFAVDFVLPDLPTARALVAHLSARAWREHGMDLTQALRAPPPEPSTCCGRGCNGCVWEGFYAATQYWVNDAAAWLNARRA